LGKGPKRARSGAAKFRQELKTVLNIHGAVHLIHDKVYTENNVDVKQFV